MYKPGNRRLSVLAIFVAGITLEGCSPQENTNKGSELEFRFVQYATSVADSFHIRVQLPLQYYEYPEAHYPTVLLLDGNFFSPMLSPVLHQYEATGLLKPVILVSIGYKSFKDMDSLRVRDYLYPKALPSDEIESMGGGQRFNTYILEELLPMVDLEYRTDKNARCLMGHSFGGYFVLYSLLDQLEKKKNSFKTFIAASPQLWYNDFYLNKLPALMEAETMDNVNIFISVGALEDSIWSVRPVEELARNIGNSEGNAIVESRIYTHMEHMDVAMISFTKGLQEFLQ